MQNSRKNSKQVQQSIFNKLPMKCAAFIEKDQVVALITKGVNGYMPIIDADLDFVEEFNKDNGVDSAIQKAMIFGATISWESPGIDPAKYHQNS